MAPWSAPLWSRMNLLLFFACAAQDDPLPRNFKTSGQKHCTLPRSDQLLCTKQPNLMRRSTVARLLLRWTSLLLHHWFGMKTVWRLAIHLAMHTFLNWVVLKKCNNLWLLIAAWRGTFLPFIYLYKLMLKILLILLIADTFLAFVLYSCKHR
jgi:hypothetical protein